MNNRSIDVTERNYWDHYYATHRSEGAKLPSQFAVFVLGELDSIRSVVELGCGNGRDSIFFASRGLRVLGIDASSAGISDCRSTASRLKTIVSFERSTVGEDDTWQIILDNFGMELSDTVIYARFFLHALNESAEGAFLDLAKKAADCGARIAVEFRTNRDAAQPKETAKHYRRFINPLDFVTEVSRRGMKILYFVDGFGFAKFREDDAHVARFVIGANNGS